jgi:hypothetical protein
VLRHAAAADPDCAERTSEHKHECDLPKIICARGHTCQHGFVSHSSTSMQTLAPSAPNVVRYIGYGHSPHCRPPKANEQAVSASHPPLLAAQRSGPDDGTLAGASAQLSPTQLSMQRQLRGQKEWPMGEDIYGGT